MPGLAENVVRAFANAVRVLGMFGRSGFKTFGPAFGVFVLFGTAFSLFGVLFCFGRLCALFCSDVLFGRFVEMWVCSGVLFGQLRLIGFEVLFGPW